MDTNKKEDNLINENNKQDLKDIELKEIDNIQETNDIKEDNEIPDEVKNQEKQEEKGGEKSIISSENDGKNETTSDEDSETSSLIGKKIMKTVLLNLNSYWIGLIASITLFTTLYIYECLGIYIIAVLDQIISEKTITVVNELIDLLINKLGVKWLLIINISDHLSLGFFCLTTFSSIFHDTKSIKKFFIIIFIEVILYYGLCVLILGLLINTCLRNHIKEVIEDPDASISDSLKEGLINLANILIDSIVIIIADFLSTYNIFLEKLILGSLYLFIFYKPKNGFSNKKLLIFFRSLSAIPIAFIIVSLVLRALQKLNGLEISEYLSPILLGQKVTIYGFFIVTLFVIKYKSKKYSNVFDEEGYIDTKVFTKIGSSIFAIFGAIEFIAGLFFPEWASFGIGRKYLIILCAPIFTLYDYKKEHKVTFPCCHKGDMSKCFKIVVNIIGYFLIILFGLIFVILAIAFISKYIVPLFVFIIEHWDELVNFISLLKKLFNI